MYVCDLVSLSVILISLEDWLNSVLFILKAFVGKFINSKVAFTVGTEAF